MQSALIVIGFLFLINPSVFSLDVLPDFIGLFLISKGLFRFSLLSDHMEKARKYVHYLLLFSGVKLMLSFSLFSTPIESNRLLASFIGAVGEWILYPLLVKNFFDGLDAIGVREGGTGMYRGMDVTKIITLVFLIARSALDLIPNAVVLFFPDVDADPYSVEGYGFVRQQYTGVRNWTLIVCAVLTLAFGIYAARIVFAYRGEVKRDTVFVNALKADYQKRVLENEIISRRVALRRAMTYFTVAPVFLVPLFFEKMNFLPRPLFFLFVFLGTAALAKELPQKKWLRPFLIASFAVSLAAFGFRLYLLSTALNFDAAFRASAPALILDASEAVLSLGALFLMVKTALSAAKKVFSWYPVAAEIIAGAFFAVLTVLDLWGDHFTYQEDVFLFLRWAAFAVGVIVHRKWIVGFLDTVDEKLI